MHENRGLTLAPSPLPESEPGTSPSGPTHGPGPTPFFESLSFPSKSEMKSALSKLWTPLEQNYLKAKSSLMPQEQASIPSLEDLARPWPEITGHPFTQICEPAMTGWNQDKPDPARLRQSWQSQAADLRGHLMQIRAWAVYEVLKPETWNLWALPVASYDRTRPLQWLHVRMPEGSSPRENQSCLIADPWGEILGAALVRFPPLRCRPQLVAELALDRWPLLLALPQ